MLGVAHRIGGVVESSLLRQELHEQINELPDDIVREIADFMAFVLARQRMVPQYADWTDADWQQFTLNQFFRDTDTDIEYSLSTS
jgi:hypothetical protein